MHDDLGVAEAAPALGAEVLAPTPKVCKVFKTGGLGLDSSLDWLPVGSMVNLILFLV